jgi:hypothetical protein
MSEERVKNPNLPRHFTGSVSADRRLNPRWLAVGGDGTVYASGRNIGGILMLRNENGGGKADVMKTGAFRSDMHDITIPMAGPRWSRQ